MSDCIVWTGRMHPDGYGIFNWGGTQYYAHRFAYEQAVGPIPAGLEIDHLCRVRACYNPDHLEAVTHAENQRRNAWSMRTECPRGHPYDEQNTYRSPTNGKRKCRACVRLKRKAMV